MTQIQNNNQQNINLLNESVYLTTKAVLTNKLPQQKVSGDLDMLKKAEEKTTYRANIAKGEKNPQIYRALSALRLSNPFRGY